VIECAGNISLQFKWQVLVDKISGVVGHVLMSTQLATSSTSDETNFAPKCQINLFNRGFCGTRDVVELVMSSIIIYQLFRCKYAYCHKICTCWRLHANTRKQVVLKSRSWNMLKDLWSHGKKFRILPFLHANTNALRTHLSDYTQRNLCPVNMIWRSCTIMAVDTNLLNRNRYYNTEKK